MLKFYWWIFYILPLLCTALQPVLAADPSYYISFDENTNVLSAEGKVISSGILHGRANYLPGVSGQALDVRRQAYDQVTAVKFKSLPAMNYDSGTVSFWFKPQWNESDAQANWIVSANNYWKGFRFYLIKHKNGKIELSVCAPGQIQIKKKGIFTKDKWTHIAFSWDIKKNEVRLYCNGKEIAKAVKENKFKPIAKKAELVLDLGNGNTDRFKGVVGDGVYDEIKYFNKALSPSDIFILASGEGNVKLSEINSNLISQNDNTTQFVFRYKNPQLSSPQKLMTLTDDSGKELILNAMGASGRISLIAGKSKRSGIVEANYKLLLDQPHKITLKHNSGALQFYLDDALQGSIKMSEPFGKLKSTKGVSGISILPLSEFPSAKESLSLSDSKISSLEKSLWSFNNAQNFTEGVRSGVCLNGYWRVKPVNSYSYAPPSGKWGYMRVPGSFRSPLFQIYTDNNNKLESLNWQWNSQQLIKYRAGWYQRNFIIPEEIKKKRIYLNLKNLNGDYGRVYLNGKLIDSFRQDFKCFTVVANNRRIDITEIISKDDNNVLTVFIDRYYVGLWKGKPSIGDHGEIAIGDVWLESAPAKISIKTAIALPSFRNKEVSMRSRIQNSSGLKGRVKIRYDFKRQGKTEKSFVKHFDLNGTVEQLVTFKEKWNNPVLWDAEDPNLYQMTVALDHEDKIVDTLPVKDFGFREMWVENGAFWLNGKKTRLRMWSSPGIDRLRYYYGAPNVMGQYIEHIKELNYDTVRFNPLKKTSQVAWKSYLKESDSQGLYNLFPMPPYENEELTSYTKEIERFLEQYGNHPSILMWYTDFNTCSYPWNQDPAKLNDTEYIPVDKKKARQLTQIAEKVMRSLDPSRELFQHAGGNSGKIFTSMNYQSFGTPLQEQEDWPKQWAESHTQPLMTVECAFPYPWQFWHFDKPKLGTLLAEHAARYLGDAAYSYEKLPIPNASRWINSPYADLPANWEKLSAMLYKNVVKAWRAYDVSAIGDFPGGRDFRDAFKAYTKHNVVYEVNNNVKTAGLKPDIFNGWSETQRHIISDYTKPDYLFNIIRSAFNPLLVFIGGNPSDFTNKDHAYFAGELFKKSAVVVNDHTTTQDLEIHWKLVVGNNIYQKGRISCKANPGEILKLPIELTAPKVLKRTNAELHLTAIRNNALYAEDSLALQFFPKRNAPKFTSISAGLYDPEGKTANMLSKAGFPFHKVTTVNDIKKCRLLIIGQNALKKGNPEFLKQAENAGLIERGLKILIFEQSASNLGNFVFESPSYRDAFIRCPDNLYTSGLHNEDFSNWRGSSDTVAEFVLSDEKSPHYPRSKWKCGNGGIVSGNVIRKPSYGNFKTIVDCGFNLMFASLMELRKGHGLILFCQLDVTSRYLKDPVATKLVDNMLVEMGKRYVPVGPQRVGYLGDGSNEQILKRMGMNYSKLSSSNLWGINGQQVIILDKNPVPADKKDVLKKRLANKTVITLPGAPLDWLSDKMKRGIQNDFRCFAPDNDPVFNGIPNADLYFRQAQNLPVLTVAPEWIVSTKPAVFAKLDRIENAAVILNLPPDDIKGLWNKEKITRVWSAIFNNMNIGLGRDLKLFTSTKSRHNTIRYRLGEIQLTQASIRFDPANNQSVSDKKGFAPIKLGEAWENQGHQQENPNYKYPQNTPKKLIKPYDGYAWYRCTVQIPKSWEGHKISLQADAIDDCDWTYFNGTKIGETTFENTKKPYKVKRSYTIPQKLVKFGANNELMIRVFDRWGNGGITGSLKVIAEDAQAKDSWSPYIDGLNFYDGGAFHNW